VGLGKWLKKLRGDEQAGSVAEGSVAEKDDSEPRVDVDAIKLDQEAGRIAGISADEAEHLSDPDA
jgi:hypothetical protein